MLTSAQISKLNLNENQLKLSKRMERYQYLGILTEYQLHPPSIREINAWKQTLCNKQANAYLSKTFKSSPLAQYIANIPADETLDDYQNTFTFKQLGINYEDVVIKFLSIGLLPKNYFILKPNEHQKSIQ